MSAVLILLAVSLAIAGEYQFIVYPVSQQANINALGLPLGLPRTHPDGALRLTSLAGNVPFTPAGIALVSQIDSLHVIGSDSIATFLQSGGWNQGGGLP